MIGFGWRPAVVDIAGHRVRLKVRIMRRAERRAFRLGCRQMAAAFTRTADRYAAADGAWTPTRHDQNDMAVAYGFFASTMAGCVTVLDADGLAIDGTSGAALSRVIVATNDGAALGEVMVAVVKVNKLEREWRNNATKRPSQEALR